MKFKNLPRLLFSIGICEGAGIVGSFFTFSAIPAWYSSLNKPSFAPPNFIFGPIWITLYFLIGIALYLIWTSRKNIKGALFLFWIHLFFNATWSIAFFGLRSPLLGFINILILLFLILVVIYKFWKINKLAGALFLPYLVWVSFATVLNYNILILN